MIERDAPDTDGTSEEDITQDGSVPGDADLITPDAEANPSSGPEAGGGATGDAPTKDPDETAAGAADQAGVDVGELSESEKDRELRHY